MAQRANLIATYNANPTLQKQYTLDQYLALFDFGQTPQPAPNPPPTRTPTPTPDEPGLPNIINQNLGGGNDRQGGGGAFGNLDVSDVKTFQKDVYNAKTGQFEQQTVTGYKNPAMGNYQTFDGKNINHAGIGFKGIAGMAMEALGFGPKRDEKGYYDGQIAGTFTGFKPTDFKNMGEFLKTRKDRQKFMDDNKKTLDAIERERLRQEAIEINARIAREESARQYNPNIHGPTNYGLGGDGQQSFDSGQGFGTNATTGGPVSNRTGRGRTDYDDGGRVYLYNRLK